MEMQCVFREIQTDFLGAFAQLRKSTVTFFISPPARPQGTQLTMDVFSKNIIFEIFSKICPENSSFIKI